jgi:hypothetical protein
MIGNGISAYGRGGRFMRLGIALAATVAASCLCAGQAFAATPAQETIAAAEAIHIGEDESGGGHHIEYWTVQLVGGDRVILHVKQPANNGGYRFELYAPGTSPTRFEQSPPAAFATTSFSGAEEVATTLQAPYSGNFLLAVCQNADRVGGEDCHSVGASSEVMSSYAFSTTPENGGITGVTAEDESRAGSSVATANVLNGAFEAGGGDHIDFWTVQLVGGERVPLRVRQPPNNGGYRFELYAPGTSETQFEQSTPAAFATTSFSGAEEVATTIEAPYSGRFLLAVCQNADRVNGEDCHSVGAAIMEPYAFTLGYPSSGSPGGSSSPGNGGGGAPEGAKSSTASPTVGAATAAPQLAVSGNVAPVSGTVTVELPGTRTFVALSTLRQIPFGTVIDATHGRVSVTAAAPHGGTQTGEFSEGEFVLRQGANGVVDAELTGGAFAFCPTARERSHMASVAATHASGKHAVRKLWANAHGSFSTKGNYVIATVEGTEWLTEDLCEGTLVRVRRDKVAVTNLVNHRRVTVKAGHQYLAKAP